MYPPTPLPTFPNRPEIGCMVPLSVRLLTLHNTSFLLSPKVYLWLHLQKHISIWFWKYNHCYFYQVFPRNGQLSLINLPAAFELTGLGHNWSALTWNKNLQQNSRSGDSSNPAADMCDWQHFASKQGRYKLATAIEVVYGIVYTALNNIKY